MEYFNIALQISGWNNLFYVDSLSDITKHSLYDIVPLVVVKGFELDNNSVRKYRTLVLNRWLILAMTIPGNHAATDAPLDTTIALPQVLAETL